MLLLASDQLGSGSLLPQNQILKCWDKLPLCCLLISTCYSSLTKCMASLWAKYNWCNIIWLGTRSCPTSSGHEFWNTRSPYVVHAAIIFLHHPYIQSTTVLCDSVHTTDYEMMKGDNNLSDVSTRCSSPPQGGPWTLRRTRASSRNIR